MTSFAPMPMELQPLGATPWMCSFLRRVPSPTHMSACEHVRSRASGRFSGKRLEPTRLSRLENLSGGTSAPALVSREGPFSDLRARRGEGRASEARGFPCALCCRRFSHVCLVGGQKQQQTKTNRLLLWHLTCTHLHTLTLKEGYVCRVAL